MKKTPTVLLIMDGFGLGDACSANALYLAKTPVIDKLLETCPHTALFASGLDVGLPAGQIGNSEVGHTNIGAGRIVFQALPRISRAIEDESFFKNEALLSAMHAAKGKGAALHILGLVSDGGVHSHIAHLYALMKMAKNLGLSKIYIHAFLDGRDTPPKSGAQFMKDLEAEATRLGEISIATVQGRFFAMDRDNRWDRVQKAYNAVARGIGARAQGAEAAVLESYKNGISDEFVEPVILDEGGMIKSGDSVIFANFRPDRARELTRALTGALPESCPLDVDALELNFVCMAQYDEALSLPIAFPSEKISETLGEHLSSLGFSQLRIAETEKYAHVTFFLNGGVETLYKGEDRILVNSPKEPSTYDLIPEMSAREVTEKCTSAIESGEYDVIICNLANCDMVGHTGSLPAAVEAAQVVDECAGKILSAAARVGGITLVTADHGNADCMMTPDGAPHTAHTTSLVPLIISGASVSLRPGKLCDIAPTMLDLMGCEKPQSMTGTSLIIKE